MQNSTDAFHQGLQRTKTRFLGRISRVLLGRQRIDEEKLDEIEEILLSADVDLETTQKIISGLSTRVKQNTTLIKLSYYSYFKKKYKTDYLQLISRLISYQRKAIPTLYCLLE